MYSDEGGYLRDGGEEGALYAEEDGDMYGEDGEYTYEEEEEMPYEEDEDMYPLDGTISEDQEPPYTPTPTSTAPTLMPPSDGMLPTRPPLEKQASLHQQQPAHDHLNPPSTGTGQLPVTQEDQLHPFATDSSKIPFTPTQTDLSTPITHTPTAVSQIPPPDTEPQELEPKPEPRQEEPQPLDQAPEGESSLPAPEEKQEEPPVPRCVHSFIKSNSLSVVHSTIEATCHVYFAIIIKHNTQLMARHTLKTMKQTNQMHIWPNQ